MRDIMTTHHFPAVVSAFGTASRQPRPGRRVELMSIAALRSQMDAGPQRRERESSPSIDLSVGFIPALFSGGDARMAPDPLTGLKKFLGPPMPAPDLVCLSSCTASPILVQGF